MSALNNTVNSSFPNSPPEKNPDKCQMIYWNILCCIEAGAPAETLIHELAETSGCDHIQDLSNVRNAVESKASSQVIGEILNNTMDPKPIKVVERVVGHYSAWADNEVYKGLTFLNQVYYHTYFRWDKWASGVALFGGTVGGLFKVYRRRAGKF
mmetsp:Transcript_17217/g.25759  ORF Transcript_17217/g.25759 Transcript_17217/m.25759 type:complete len:154 (-) Transcript_17217:162-623(-)